jgi:hypothetical protein
MIKLYYVTKNSKENWFNRAEKFNNKNSQYFILKKYRFIIFILKINKANCFSNFIPKFKILNKKKLNRHK